MRATSQKNFRAFRFPFMAASTVLIFSACSHQAIVPEAKNVKLQRENPSKNCVEIGKVQGSVQSVHGTIEQAIEDMKLDAARKGANFVRMESTSAIGTSVSGTAFQCP
jgi:phage terminase large subunit